jgi:hypothetical protein
MTKEEFANLKREIELKGRAYELLAEEDPLAFAELCRLCRGEQLADTAETNPGGEPFPWM